MTESQAMAIETRDLTYTFGRRTVLQGLELEIPSGAFYALLGANGAGKTTLLQLIAGARPMQQGTLQLFSSPAQSLTIAQRRRITYVAEGQQLPMWMRLSQLESFCAPLYSTWDFALAAQLRRRFDLDATQRIGSMSRGQRMKVALLCALAPRPQLIVMDEPFTGMDVAVKDDLVRGLLDTASLDGATVVLCTHDIAEIEPLADWVGMLDNGRLRLSAPLDELRARYRQVDLITDASTRHPEALPANWISVERAGLRLRVLIKDCGDRPELPAPYRDATRVEVREASLKELYLALGATRNDPRRALAETSR